jgi:hypothetical protein
MQMSTPQLELISEIRSNTRIDADLGIELSGPIWGRTIWTNLGSNYLDQSGIKLCGPIWVEVSGLIWGRTMSTLRGTMKTDL